MDQIKLEDVATSKTVLASSAVSKSPKCFGSGSAEPSWKMDWIDLVALWSRGSLLKRILIKFSTSNCWTPATWTEYNWMLFPISFLKWIQYNLTDIVILFVKPVLPSLPMLPAQPVLSARQASTKLMGPIISPEMSDKMPLTLKTKAPSHLPTVQGCYTTRVRDTASHFFPAWKGGAILLVHLKPQILYKNVHAHFVCVCGCVSLCSAINIML